MKRIFTFFALIAFCYQAQASFIITGVCDGPLTGGTKVIELYATANIADMSIYGIESASNGAPSVGQEIALPSGSVNAGDFVWLTNSDVNFQAYFGFASTAEITSLGSSFNGDDAILLYENGAIIDVMGAVGTDGTGEPWDHLDGWAYRTDATGPDGSTFVLGNWTFSGADALDGTTTNAGAINPFPFGTYMYTPPANPIVSFVGANASVGEAAGTTTIDISIAAANASATSVDVMVDAASTATAADYSLSATNFTFGSGSSMNQTLTVTIVDDAMAETPETIVLNLMNPTNGATLGSNSTFTLTITDNDTPIPALVITEIMYNSPESGADTLEYIEIYNNDAMAWDLAGMSFTAGVTHTFATSMILNPGDYFVLCNNSAAFQNAYGMIADQWDSGSLTNGGETITLVDASANLVDEVTYDDVTPWTSDPDGFGPSLELCDVNADNADPINWFAGNNPTGVIVNGTEILATPGAANTVTCLTNDPIIGFEFSSFTTNENAGTLTFGVTISNGNANPTTVTLSADAASTADVTDYSFAPAMVTFPAGVGEDTMDVTITLIDDAVVEMVENIIFNMTGDNMAQVFGNTTYEVTINDDDFVAPDVVINEIHYNNPGTDTFEFVEFYNNDANPVDLMGYTTTGITHTFTTSTVLNPGDYLVLAFNAAELDARFGTTSIQWDGGSLNNGGETIRLISPSGSVVDEVQYDDAAPWATEPDGAGNSLVLCDVNADNNDGTNWGAEQTATGIFAGGIEAFITPGAANDCTVSVNEIASSDIKIYPNPTRGSINIESNVVLDEVRVFNVLGQNILSMNNLNDNVILDASNWNNGVYFIHLTSEGKTLTQQIVVNK